MLPENYSDVVRLKSDLHIREGPRLRQQLRANKNSQCLNVFLRSCRSNYLK